MRSDTVISSHAWAKLDGQHALPLSDHGTDVAATFASIVGQTHWLALLENAAGRPLAPQDLDRMCVLAYLHDLGKVNRGFWARQFTGSPIVGHTNETAALFLSRLKHDPTIAPLNRLIDDWVCWDHFVAVMAHHGTPLPAYSEASELAGLSAHPHHWYVQGCYDPMAELADLLSDVVRRFPLAFSDGPPLPNTTSFVVLLGGLVTLTDWLGSDMALFPVAGPHFAAREALRADSAKDAIHSRGLADQAIVAAEFEEAFTFAPRGAQTEADDPTLGPIALLEAETGSGKTEAAIWRWLRLRAAGEVDGLYFALPTRAAAVQLHGRINAVLDRLTGGTVKAVLAVPGEVSV